MDYFDLRDTDKDLFKNYTDDLDNSSINIKENFEDSTIFLTGGSGFLGKILIEKLLRSCEGVKKIYLLLRAKKDKRPEERLDELLLDPLFLPVIRAKGYNYARSKLFIIKGDCNEDGLGMDENSKELIMKEVNFVFHSAASLRMDGALTKSFDTNVRATHFLLGLAEKTKGLRGFIYVSTAYSHAHRVTIEEVFYDSGMSFKTFNYLKNNFSESQITALNPKILGNVANNYAFTKAMAENVVESYAEKFPVAVVRPSIILSSVREPVIGWCSSVNGAIGLLLGICIGLVHVLNVKVQSIADIVPVDIVSNGTLAAAAKISQMSRNQTKDSKRTEDPVFNLVAYPKTFITYNSISTNTKNVIIKEDGAFSKIMLGPFYITTSSNNIIAYFLNLILHIIPGLLIDAILWLANKKPRMIRLYKGVHKNTRVLTYYSCNEWEFKQTNVDQLWNEMSASEKNEFYFDMNNFNWELYTRYYIRAMRLYLLKDTFDTMDITRIKTKWFYFYFKTAMVLVTGFILMVLYNKL